MTDRPDIDAVKAALAKAKNFPLLLGANPYQDKADADSFNRGVQATKDKLLDEAPALIAYIEALEARLAASEVRVNVLEAHLTEAIERVEKGDLDDRMCCNGHMCGCQGSTNAEQFLHFARAALAGDAA